MTNAGTTCCDQYGASRRNFLKGLGVAAAGGAYGSTHDGVYRSVAFADATPGTASSSENILVVLSLRGGCDGLSLVVPYGDHFYAAARPTIGVPTSRVMVGDGFFGLHPKFAPMRQLWLDGRVAAIHAVGLPAPNRSHFTAMEEVEEADPGSSARIGWINRLVGIGATSDPGEAIGLGSAMVPTSLYGPQEVLTMPNVDSAQLPGGTDAEGSWKRASLDYMWGRQNSPLSEGAQAALSSSARVGKLSSASTQHDAAYPATPLGDTLKDSVRLIRGFAPVKVITIDYGSWDMHVNLGTMASGTMNTMVDELARAIAAFFADLGSAASRVTLVTISEFGRRVAENGNRGTDHGYGNAMMVVGGGVNGGKFYGNWPGLGAADLVDGDLAVTRDYRSVLSEVLASRFDLNLSTVFPGFQPEPYLGMMQGV